MTSFDPFADLTHDALVGTLAKHIARGNRKLPRATAILNLCAATDCPSRRLGLCRVARDAEARRAQGQAAHDCYALKAERGAYPAVLPYRRRQDTLTRLATGAEVAEAVASLRGVSALRVSEAGDFRTQADVDKLEEAARLLQVRGIVTYCYTARRDLDFSGCDALTVNGSGFVPNGGGGNTFAASEEVPSGALVCPGDCRVCSLCTKRHGRTVYVHLH